MTTSYFKVVTDEPLILYGHWIWPDAMLGPASFIEPWIADRPARIFIGNPYIYQDDAVEPLVKSYRAYAHRHPDHELTFCCNTDDETAWLARLGVPAITLNHNAFVDDRVFTVEPGAEPRYDAIYNARTNPTKRHELAREVRSLALIYRFWLEHEIETLDEVRRILPHAKFLNGMPPDHRPWWKRTLVRGHRELSRDKVAHWLNRSRVGLCLSAVEGAMWSAMEYLMTGLPIVSTPSRGGRDHYFDDAFCTIVEPDPRAVAEAVAELAGRRIDRMAVRAATLETVGRDRARFVALCEAFFARLGVDRRLGEDLGRFIARPFTYQVDAETMARLGFARPSAPVEPVEPVG